MWNIYIKYLISSLRNKEVFIWNLAFPLVMATLFAFAFADLDNGVQLKQFPVGIVVNQEYEDSQSFKAALDSMESEKVFKNIEFSDEEKAKDGLEKGVIQAYIMVTQADHQLVPTMTVKEDGINQTIVKSFLDSYVGTESTVKTIIEKIYSSSLSLSQSQPIDINQIISGEGYETFTKEISLTKNKPTLVVTYFYGLLAMTCMYGAFGGVSAIINTGANLSERGARNLVSGTKKSTLNLAYMLSSITSLFITIMIILAYILLVLKVDFGDRIGYIILTCFVGSLFGIGFGTAVCSIPKIKKATMTGIVISVSMLSSFVAGLMNRDIAYIIMSKMPYIGAINPGTRIADAFYCLYCYDSLDRYWDNILSILMMTVTMFAIGMFTGRKVRYDSI